jgi:hypothetical protein
MNKIYQKPNLQEQQVNGRGYRKNKCREYGYCILTEDISMEISG